MVTQIGRLAPNEAEIARNRALFPGTWSSGRIAAEHDGLVAEYELNPAGWSPERVRSWLIASGDDEPEAILDCDDVLLAWGHKDAAKRTPLGIFAFVWRVWANYSGSEVPGRGRRTVKRVNLDLDYIWVEPGFRRQGVAYGLLAAFIGGYCTQCKVSVDFNDELPRNRRVDECGVILSVMNRCNGYRHLEDGIGEHFERLITAALGEAGAADKPSATSKRPWLIRKAVLAEDEWLTPVEELVSEHRKPPFDEM